MKKRYLPQFHLYPPQGWLNDPNGLCQLNGIHHIFFQYSPDNPRGADKYWGHYQTRDFINYEFTGCLLGPDIPEDINGVFSGCAYVEDGIMYLYYTGNVEKEGDHDLILEGREGNTILVTSEDGINATDKECLLHNSDYPSNLSLHVRDPKVFSKSGKMYMVLGARTKDDKGCVLLYTSDDKRNWVFKHFIQKPDYGFMWECPDLFEIDGHQYLSLSPQGLPREEYRFQNIFHTGYFETTGDLLADGSALGEFTEWDYGFDFYAPQTYADEKGRRIIIGWMGVSGQEYDHDPTIDEGWQHMLTLPREITVSRSGKLLQNPVSEIESLRGELLWHYESKDDCNKFLAPSTAYISVQVNNRDFELMLGRGVVFTYNSSTRLCKLKFTDDALGYGRTERNVIIGDNGMVNARFFIDTCAIEVYINDGSYVMTTKFFPKPGERLEIMTDSVVDVKLYEFKGFNIV